MGAPTFRQVYDEHFRFVWRSLRRIRPAMEALGGCAGGRI